MRTTQVRTCRDVGERPFIVIWEMTQACPLACLHCRAEARPDRHPGELTAAEARDLMAQVAEFGSPPPRFVLTGGDPFQRPDLLDLVRHGTTTQGSSSPRGPQRRTTSGASSSSGRSSAGTAPDYVAVLGLGQLYLRLRERLGELGLARRKARRPPVNVNDPYAEDPWCSYQPGTFPTRMTWPRLARGRQQDRDNTRQT